MKIALYLRTYALFVVLMSVCLPLNSQSFNPEIENYSIKDYNADNQNWGIDVDSDGVVYVANNKGLLMYTGEVWKLFELPNNTIVRSVLVDQNRIYTGSYEEFGFWTKNSYGGIKYTSLVNKFDASHDFTNEQFWQITSYKEKIFFKSISGGIYVYDGDAIKYIENSVDTFDMVVYQNKLIIGNRSRGLLQVHNDKLIPYRGREDVLPKLDSINNVASVGEQLFFFDLKNGGFLYNSTLKKAKSLPKKINLFLYKSILNKATFLDEDTLIFGTIKEGLILYNIKLNTLKQINNISGLNNNTVLDLKFKQGLLWVALDNGLSKINFKSPFLFYKDDTGILGRVYDVVFFKNKYYLASNTGVYMLSKTRELKLIDNTEGHVWSLDIINNQLFVNHNEGSFVINSDTISEKIHSDGVYRMIKVPKKKNQYLQSTYTGIRLVRKNEKSWYSVSVKNISFLVNKIVFESDSVIWASHPYKGVFRIQLNKNYTEALKIKAYEKIQNHNLYQTKICKINDTILFYNSGLWFTYLKNKDSIVSYERFQKFNNKALISYGDKGGWLIDKENRITYFDENYLEINQIDMSEVKRRSVSGFEKIKAQNDSLRIINLNDGFALFTMNEIEEKDNKEVKTPIINRIYSKNKEFSINEFKLRIPYKDAQYLSFEISTPYLYGGGKYSYNLYGKINQNELFNKGKLTLQNLAYGDYVLAIKNNSIKEKISKIKELHFTVLPP
ncbi:hypothetical protein [Polaribacter sp. HL-MS24]|uniref:hypothetical protein n=1 Tax=Polaribacter sp. HL-MS24 TaxID=3077735 RepID=UPI0029347052|nr:hypothetical protein [Polaribacter sp. HL-MS24]WOC40888.1 hypothetical protein RRF69_03690 [Polaribacter sp. HL-MS24]